ncbi:MAG: hypothetical protein WCC36_10040 [Gammaproteobacteria bacterium]
MRSTVTAMAARMAHRHPRTYLAGNAVLAILGYAYLSAFPMLTLLALGALALRLTGAPLSADWPMTAALALAGAAGVAFNYTLMRLHPAHSSGHSVGRAEASELWDLVDDIRRHYASRLLPGGPVIHDICITPQAELELMAVPRWGLPLMYTRTLLVGLPLLQTVAPHQFEALLARKIGQCSGRGDPLGAWLYRLRQVWSVYENPPPLRPAIFRLAFTAFFKWYAPLFRLVSSAAARDYEFRGDRYAFEFSSYEDAIDALCAQAVSTRFLEDKFWPAFERLSRAVPRPTRLPYVSLERAFVKGVKQSETASWLRKAWVLTGTQGDPMPSLRERLEQICDYRPRSYTKPSETAANLYLRSTVLAILTSRMDREWLTENLSAWRKRYAQRKHADQQLAALRRRREGTMSSSEIKRYLALVKANYDGRSAAALYRDLIAAHPDNAKVLFIAGQRLAGLGDQAGVEALERAMAVDERCADTACKLISKFNLRQRQAA